MIKVLNSPWEIQYNICWINQISNYAASEELENAKGIVLVEKAMSTMYEEIIGELELASRQGIKVLGGIIVE